MHLSYRSFSLIFACAALVSISVAQTNLPPQNHNIVVQAGVPLHVVLDHRASYTKVGRQLHGRIAQPVYVLDQVAIPTGTEVLGKVSEVHSVSKHRRFDAMASGDFTPLREAQVEFDTLVLQDGKQ